jgi:fucose permease
MGMVSDASGSMQTAYIIPMLSFIVTLYFAIWGYKVKTVN